MFLAIINCFCFIKCIKFRGLKNNTGTELKNNSLSTSHNLLLLAPNLKLKISKVGNSSDVVESNDISSVTRSSRTNTPNEQKHSNAETKKFSKEKESNKVKNTYIIYLFFNCCIFRINEMRKTVLILL